MVATEHRAPRAAAIAAGMVALLAAGCALQAPPKPEDTRSQALVRAIVQLADAMGITTVAEFVETTVIRDRLAALGIQFGQGYALGRPGPLDDVLAAVADRAPEGRERPFTEPKAFTTPSGIPIMFKHA